MLDKEKFPALTVLRLFQNRITGKGVEEFGKGDFFRLEELNLGEKVDIQVGTTSAMKLGVFINSKTSRDSYCGK